MNKEKYLIWRGALMFTAYELIICVTPLVVGSELT